MPRSLSRLRFFTARGWIIVAAALIAVLTTPAHAGKETPPETGPVVAGDRAAVRGQLCAAPANAPLAVKKAIWACNYLVGRPYVWGGGHGTFYDRGYDCSGSISFLLHHAGVLAEPTTSKALKDYGEPGPGRWITIYAKDGHTFAIVCGIRLDTTGASGRDEGPRWRRNDRGPAGFVARHPPGM